MDNPLTSQKSYDYIIAGAGCAGLSLLYQLLNTKELQHKQILIIDQTFDKTNDRTWCFWEEDTGRFEQLVCKSWPTISIHHKAVDSILPTAPFVYKMIQGIDFYNHVIQFAKAFLNVTWLAEKITKIEPSDGQGLVYWQHGMASSHFVFSSLTPKYTILPENPLPFLWQHFKGILVEFEESIFDDKVARLMDFNVSQKEATAFIYILPLSSKKALVEYTLFSPALLEAEAYDHELKTYLAYHYPGIQYTILHNEFGAIPMTQQSLSNYHAPIYAIGTLSGAVKASTGYAFQFIQAQAAQIIQQLLSGNKINTTIHNTRHHFFDAVLLHILANHKMEGSLIFSRIFKKNKASTVFKFLSNTSTIFDDIKIMKSLPTNIFLPAALNVLFKRFISSFG